jgi:hypothetical protein
MKAPREKYIGEFLGERVCARTLPDFFETVVNMTSAVAPEVLVELSTWCMGSRRFVAAGPDTVHPDSPHLPVVQTASGWWVSKNIGQEDLKRALWALCHVSRLTFGSDVTFNTPGPT